MDNIQEEGFTYFSSSMDKGWSNVKLAFIKKLQVLEDRAFFQKLRYPLRCRICGKSFESKTYCLDGWIWPDILKHYVLEHNVKPSPSFMEYFLPKFKNFSQLEKKYYNLENVYSTEAVKRKFLRQIGYIDFFRRKDSVHPLPLFHNSFPASWPKSVRTRFILRLKNVESFTKNENQKAVKRKSQQSECAVCQEKGSYVYSLDNYTWTSLLKHYIDCHKFQTSYDFYKKILSKTDSIRLLKSEQFMLNKGE